MGGRVLKQSHLLLNSGSRSGCFTPGTSLDTHGVESWAKGRGPQTVWNLQRRENSLSRCQISNHRKKFLKYVFPWWWTPRLRSWRMWSHVEIKCQLDATDNFYCRFYYLLNMFRAPLCPSSGAREYYTSGCCLSTGHTTLSATPYRQLENQSTKYDTQQPLV